MDTVPKKKQAPREPHTHAGHRQSLGKTLSEEEVKFF
jgi:hypothetical protein